MPFCPSCGTNHPLPHAATGAPALPQASPYRSQTQQVYAAAVLQEAAAKAAIENARRPSYQAAHAGAPQHFTAMPVPVSQFNARSVAPSAQSHGYGQSVNGTVPMHTGATTAKRQLIASAQRAAQAAVQPAEQKASGNIYIVRAGDTPSHIAHKHTGRKDMWPALVSANPQKATNKSDGNFMELKVGEVLHLPASWTPVHTGAVLPFGGLVTPGVHAASSLAHMGAPNPFGGLVTPDVHAASSLAHLGGLSLTPNGMVSPAPATRTAAPVAYRRIGNTAAKVAVPARATVAPHQATLAFPNPPVPHFPPGTNYPVGANFRVYLPENGETIKPNTLQWQSAAASAGWELSAIHANNGHVYQAGSAGPRAASQGTKQRATRSVSLSALKAFKLGQSAPGQAGSGFWVEFVNRGPGPVALTSVPQNVTLSALVS